MSRIGLILGGLAALGVGAILVSRSSSTPPNPAPALPRVAGLMPGSAYRLVVRSSLSRVTFGVDAFGQQAQTLLGRQGFNATTWEPNANGDPYVYDVEGIYQGTSGELADDPDGLTLIASTPIAGAPPAATLAYVNDRPVPLEPGATYAGRASLAFPLSLLVTRGAVQSKLADDGFTQITVYTDAKELPAAWPAGERGGDVFVVATYPSDAPARTMDVPSQVRSIWKAGAA